MPLPNPTHPQRCLSMRHLAAWMVVLLGSLLLDQSTASAQEPTNPFAKMAQGLNPANWKAPSMPKAPKFRLPSFLVPQDEQNRIVERKDGLMTDVKNTASRSWQRTKETFNPAKLNPMNMFAGMSGPPKEKSSSPGFFSNMFGGGAAANPGPEERVANVNDYLSLPRP